MKLTETLLNGYGWAGTRARFSARLQPFLARQASAVAVAALVVGVLAGFGLTTDRFLTDINLTNVVRQAAPILVAAVGATLVITAGGIDLSVGSVVAVAGTTGALLFGHGVPGGAAVVLALVLGCAVGAAHGFLIAYERLPSFIVTLGSLSVLAGIAQLETKGFALAVPSASWFRNIGQGDVAGFPVPGVIAGCVIVIGWLVLARTSYGHHLAAIGSNEEAARRAGVATNRVAALAYVIAGFMSALAGVMVASRLEAGLANAGRGLELQTIAAVVIGGTLLTGGRGSVVGTVFGVFAVALITNGLLLQNLDPFYVTIVQGVILISAIWINKRVFSKWA